MNLIELSKYLQDEQAAEDYLYEKEILERFTVCPHCGSDKLGHISRGRIKCYKCKKEWHKRKGSFLEGKQISASKFIAFLKLYADERGINRMTEELILDKKTVVEITKEIRILITKEFKGEKFDESNSAILFKKGNSLQISFDPNKRIEDAYIINFHRYKEQGNLYSFLIESNSCVNKRGKVNSIDRFLSFAKMKLISYRGIKMEFLKEHLIELLIKFNLKDQDFFDFLIIKLHFQRVADIPPS